MMCGKTLRDGIPNGLLRDCASMLPKTETSGDNAAEEWSIPVNWEEDPAIKAKRRRFTVTLTNAVTHSSAKFNCFFTRTIFSIADKLIQGVALSVAIWMTFNRRLKEDIISYFNVVL